MAYSYWYYTRRHSWGATLWRTYMLLCGSPRTYLTLYCTAVSLHRSITLPLASTRYCHSPMPAVLL